MGRPTSPFGGDVAWVTNPDGTPAPGIDVFDTPLDQLPPLTRAVRAAWGAHTPHPVASAAAVAALFAAVHDLETRLIALEA